MNDGGAGMNPEQQRILGISSDLAHSLANPTDPVFHSLSRLAGELEYGQRRIDLQ